MLLFAAASMCSPVRSHAVAELMRLEAGGRNLVPLHTLETRLRTVRPAAVRGPRGYAARFDAWRREIPLVGDHPLDFGQVGFVDHTRHVALALRLGALGSEDVALESVSTLDLARTCLLEALGSAGMCLELRHVGFLLTY